MEYEYEMIWTLTLRTFNKPLVGLYPTEKADTAKMSLPGVAKHLVNFASLLLRHYLKFSECFWALLTVKYGRFFTLVLFGYRYEK